MGEDLAPPRPPKVLLVTNIPTPYRTPVYDRLAHMLHGRLHVLYMQEGEIGRPWTLPTKQHSSTTLRGIGTARVGGRGAHLLRRVSPHVRRFAPDVIVTNGFAPPMLQAWLASKVRGIPHASLFDGWSHSEAHLSAVHRWVRARVFRGSAALIGASRKSTNLMAQYAPTSQCFVSHLAIDNASFRASRRTFEDRRYDLLWSGLFVPGKNPGFFVGVAANIAKRRAVRCLLLGDGPERQETEVALRSIPGCTAEFLGIQPQEALPNLYAQAKLLVFPTLRDAWGLVANEASAAGTPVVCTPFAGCADDLVIQAETGCVLSLDVDLWADSILRILEDPGSWNQLSSNASRQVQRYNFDDSAAAIYDACVFALSRSRRRPTA